jgi:MFS transporter, DHA1 family, inner membrane transport protein
LSWIIFGIGAVVVSSVVPSNKKASAIAGMFMGLTLENVLGVSFGTLLVQSLSWRFAFFVAAIIGVVGLFGILVFIPRKLTIPNTHLLQELAAFKQQKIWAALVTTSLGFSGLIACFTYIAPIMINVAGFSSHDLSWLIALYGVGLVIGNFFGGKASDRFSKIALYFSLIGLASVLVIFLLRFTIKH